MAGSSKEWDAASSFFDVYSEKPLPDAVADNVFILWPEVLKSLKRLTEGATHVLDYGCGTGGLCNRLSSEGFDVTGVDISKKMIEIARRHSQANIRYLIGGSDALRGIEGSFDAITSMMVFQFIEDLLPCLPLFRAIIRDGGLICVAVFNPAFVERCASAGKLFQNIRASDGIVKAEILFKDIAVPTYVRTEEQYRRIFCASGFKFESSALLPVTDEFVREHNWPLPSDVPEFLLLNFLR